MEEFEKELDSLDEALSEEEHERAAKRRFEESQLWQEHKKWHDEQGTLPKLEVWEEPVQVKAEVQDSPEPKTRHVVMGGCGCQPKSAMMQLDDDKVIAGIPAPAAEAKTYSTQSETQTYSSQSTPDTQYIAPSEKKQLYR